ncbi:energy-coupling factor transporter transmembrane component T family protein [Rhodoluna limnophila]|uniref:energy-coupling factor transporter transmembrane component T family protein n=1 Tax=Rhodoluna limnophila TaxID=232537 RepID=UPI001106D44F|nr:energy-coupling factor transporter transmembrane protein EcfT [Rhodoluna limnophila]
MFSLYRPGTSILHRINGGPKIVALAIIVLLISITGRNLVALSVAAIAMVVTYLFAGFGISGFLKDLWQTRWLVLLMVVPQLIFLTLEQTVVNSGRVLISVMFATLLSLTTKTSDMMIAIECVLGPFRRFGVAPEVVALLLSITITTIPVLAGFVNQVRLAQVARGARPRLSRTAVPVLVLALKHADEMADAMAARGVTTDRAPAKPKQKA